MFRNTFIAAFGFVLINIVQSSTSYLPESNVKNVRAHDDVIRSYRLPNNTRPQSYQVNVRTWIHEGNFTFEGNVVIAVLINEPSTSIVLHHRQLSIENLELRSLEGGVVPTTYEYDPIYEFLTVNVAVGQLSADFVYLLEINYNGVLRPPVEDDNRSVGFYRSSYVNSNGTLVWLAKTQFEPTDARHGFPCFDEPALKATFSISITHDASYSALSNMPVNSQVVNADGSITTRFEQTPIISSHKVAFMVSDFEFLENANDGIVLHRIYARSDYIQQTEFALQISVKMLDTLVDFIGVDYLIPKMDVAVIPHTLRGSIGEHWGLVTYKESSVLYDESQSNISTQVSVVESIGHQFSHMWFGNLVSPSWWNYLWLNEGFANLVGNIGVYLLYPGWSNEEYYVATARNVKHCNCMGL